MLSARSPRKKVDTEVEGGVNSTRSLAMLPQEVSNLRGKPWRRSNDGCLFHSNIGLEVVPYNLKKVFSCLAQGAGDRLTRRTTHALWGLAIFARRATQLVGGNSLERPAGSPMHTGGEVQAAAR